MHPLITPALQLQIQRFVAVIAAMVMCLMATNGHTATTLNIQGVDGELAENIRLLVTQPPEISEERQFKRYLDSLPEQVIKAMSAYGYYAAEATTRVAQIDAPLPKTAADNLVDKVTGTLTGKPVETIELEEGETTYTQITIDVVRNDPVRIRQLDVQLVDVSENDTNFRAVKAKLEQTLASGKIFLSADYESAKSSLLNTAQQLGYFDFEFLQTSVRVSRKANTADIVIMASPGERFNFGEILFQQKSFTKTFMSRWVPFESGEPYQASLIGELTQNLQSSGYFSSVRVRPLIDPRYEQIVPVRVDLTQREENQVAIGIGYSTDTEFRTKLTWGKPLLNSNGHSAEFGLSLARFTQGASFSYRIPRSEQPLSNYWGIAYSLQQDQQDDIDSVLSKLNFQRASRTIGGWTESLFLRWERERFVIGDAVSEENIEASAISDFPLNNAGTTPRARDTDLVLPGISYSRTRSEGTPFATKGESLSFQLMGGSEKLLSSINFLKAVARVRYLRALSEKNSLIGTVQYGVVKSNDYEQVPVSQRFFAGGDRSVRGFAFRDISPRDNQNNPTGGRFLEVANLEYTYRFRDRWSGALFVDAGRAFNSHHNTRYSYGAGVGIRWQSPVGPLRIDIANPISDVNGNSGSGYRIHLSLGPDL